MFSTSGFCPLPTLIKENAGFYENLNKQQIKEENEKKS